MTYTAVITGGNTGIGADLAQNLLSNGYRVICLARNAPEIEHENLHITKLTCSIPMQQNPSQNHRRCI